MQLRVQLDEDNPPVVILTGNLTEGFEAHGPYPSMNEACDAHEGEEGWLMTLNIGKVFKYIPTSRWKG